MNIDQKSTLKPSEALQSKKTNATTESVDVLLPSDLKTQLVANDELRDAYHGNDILRPRRETNPGRQPLET